MYVLILVVRIFVFFFKQKTAYEMRISDWSSDVCSSDLCDSRSPKETVVRSLLAHIAEPIETADRRRMRRRTLRLDVAARSATSEAAVVIRNLSRTGLLIETDAAFSLGENFLLVLPELGAAPARVVRADGRLFGCEFLTPLAAIATTPSRPTGARTNPPGRDT